VRIIGREIDGDLELTVADNGAGMSPQRLAQVRDNLASEAAASMDRPFFGLLQLYYNQQEGLHIDSDETGTTVRLRVPFGRGSHGQGISG